MTTKAATWFDVDKEGLSKLVADKPKVFIIHELLQNAWDQNVTNVRLFVGAGARRGEVNISVEDDDPDGFQDLAHAFTLFAESGKKSDPEKRGRFNLGEKLVLSICRKASIMTTKGTVEFNEDGTRKNTKERTEQGSLFSATVKMTKQEMLQMVSDLDYLIPPVQTTANCTIFRKPKVLGMFTATLPTQKSDDEGVLRNTARKTDVRVYEVPEGQKAHLYEMGIPVVPIDCKWHVEVQQKVPLNMNRDNVTPAYYAKLMAEVVNFMAESMTEEDAASGWANVALEHKDIEAKAVCGLLDLRFGKDRVSYDPSDPEANQTAVSEGHKVVHGGVLSKAAWNNVRDAQAIVPAGVKFATPRPFVEGGKPLTLISPSCYTEGDLNIVSFSKWLAQKLLGIDLQVSLTEDNGWKFNGAYGGKHLTLNVRSLGRELSKELYRVVLHELAHEFSSSHLDKEFYDALNKFAVEVTSLALEFPDKFRFLGLCVR